LRIPGALLLVLLLTALLVACGGNEGGNGGGGDAADRGSGTAAEEAPITELSEIVTAPDRAALAGRRVRISQVDVLEVVNNHSVFVGAGEEERLFVAVRRTPAPRRNRGRTRGAGATGAPEVRRRANVGADRQDPTGPRNRRRGAARRFGLKAEELELFLQDEQVFIRARRAEAVGEE
jgi:hypothetical protein